MFILTHPVNFPCGRKPERPEKTHDFRQSVDRLFSHESVIACMFETRDQSTLISVICDFLKLENSSNNIGSPVIIVTIREGFQFFQRLQIDT